MNAHAMRALILGLLVLLYLPFAHTAEPAEGPADEAADKSAEETATLAPVFETSLAGAVERASTDGALVLVVFMSGYSDACDAFEEHTLFSAKFQEDGGPLHVVCVNVDLEEPVARRFRVGPVPDLVLMTSEEKIVARAQEAMTAADLVRWLDEGRKRAAAGVWKGIAPALAKAPAARHK